MSCFVRKERADSEPNSSILFRILNEVSQTRRCSCFKPVTFRFPELIRAAASQVLVKTLRFVKSLQCFRGLPPRDQLLLVRHGWAPLVVLGLAQEDSVDLDTVEIRQTSLLHRILTQSEGLQQNSEVKLTDVSCVKVFVENCRSMRVTLEEYAFLKGAVLFNSDVQELLCGDYIRTLGTESERALLELERLHGSNGLLRILAAARSINPETVAGLLFKSGGNMEQEVVDVFYEI